MRDRIAHKLSVVECIALLLLVLAVFAIPGTAGPSCNVCQCIGGTGVCDCRAALPGEAGWSGQCAATDDGCLMGPGEGCEGTELARHRSRSGQRGGASAPAPFMPKSSHTHRVGTSGRLVAQRGADREPNSMWLARNRVFMKGLRRVKRVDSGLVGWTLDALIIAGTLAVMGWWWHSPPLTERPHTTAAEMGLQVGYHATIAGVSWNQSERTLFLAVRTTCPACNASVAYYRRLFDACATCRGCRDLVVSLEPRETVDAWLRKNHINARHVVTATLSTVPGLHTTPTVAIVDSSGIITDLDIGMLGSDREARSWLAPCAGRERQSPLPQRQPEW